MDQKSSFFICPRVSARFLHCFCTVSRDAMGILTCKIRQRVQNCRAENHDALHKNDVNLKLLKSECSARWALLIRGPGIRVPSSAPRKTHDQSLKMTLIVGFLFVFSSCFGANFATFFATTRKSAFSYCGCQTPKQKQLPSRDELRNGSYLFCQKYYYCALA